MVTSWIVIVSSGYSLFQDLHQISLTKRERVGYEIQKDIDGWHSWQSYIVEDWNPWSNAPWVSF